MKPLWTLLLALLAGAMTATAQWTPTAGPEGANIRSMAYVQGRLVAVSWPDLLFTYNFGAQRWEQTSTVGADRLDVLGDVLLATADDGIVRSTDAGLTWSSVGPNWRSIIRAVDEGRVYVSDQETVWRSDDTGSTWTDVGASYREQTGTALLVHGFAARGNVYVAGDELDTGVVLSFDAGTSWTHESAGAPERSTVGAVAFFGDTLLAQFTSFSQRRSFGIFLSLDSGRTWTEFNEGRAATPGGYPPVYVFRRQGGSIVATTTEGPLQLEDGRWVGVGTGFVTSIVEIGGQLYRSDFTGVQHSDDGGLTWGWMNRGLAQQSVMALASSGSAVIAGAANGVFRSEDRGASWSKVATPYLGEFVRIGHIIVGRGTTGYGDGLLRSSDGGRSWEPANLGIELPLKATSSLAADDATALVAFHAPRHLWEPDRIQFGGIYRSTDAGATWTRSDSGVAHVGDTVVPVFSVAIRGPLAVAATQEGLYRSVDSGLTWSAVPGGGSYRNAHTLLVHGGDFYFVASNRVYRSHNGLQWEMIREATSYISSLHQTGGQLFAVIGIDADYMKIERFDGTDWIEIERPTPGLNIQDLMLVGNTMYAATRNHSVMRLDASAGVGQPESARDLRVTPHPVRTGSSVRFHLDRAATVALRIVDTRGRVVTTTAPTALAAGDRQIALPTELLTTGVYAMQLVIDGSVTNRTIFSE